MVLAPIIFLGGRLPKASPAKTTGADTWRVRYDTVDADGKIILGHAGRLLHLRIGRAHARTEIIALIHDRDTIIITADTGHTLATFTLDPSHGYHRKKTGEPPSLGVHPFTMS